MILIFFSIQSPLNDVGDINTFSYVWMYVLAIDSDARFAAITFASYLTSAFTSSLFSLGRSIRKYMYMISFF